MAKEYMKPKNAIVKFHGHIVILVDASDRQKTEEGVELWLQLRPAGEIRPMASIPDGTLETYKHCRPEIVSVEWE